MIRLSQLGQATRALGIRFKAMKCSDCGQEIKEGEHCCLWDHSAGPLTVRFVCFKCSEKYEDITEKMTGGVAPVREAK